VIAVTVASTGLRISVCDDLEPAVGGAGIVSCAAARVHARVPAEAAAQ